MNGMLDKQQIIMKQPQDNSFPFSIHESFLGCVNHSLKKLHSICLKHNQKEREGYNTWLVMEGKHCIIQVVRTYSLLFMCVPTKNVTLGA